MSRHDAPRQIITALLHPGDVIITADMIRATVTAIDAREPRHGKWVECRTDKGEILRFASSPNLIVTRLSANTAIQPDGGITSGRVA